MNRKVTKALKHTLKTNIDKADMYIALAVIGKVAGATEEKNAADTEESREFIVSQLKRYKKKISEGTEQFLVAIDEAIKAIS